MRSIFGLYAVTPACLDDAKLRTAVVAAIKGGARIVQYRAAVAEAAERQAFMLADICRMYRALFIVNNAPELAKRVAADGVHLGARDMPVAAARRLLGKQMIIGVTCRNDLQAARIAQAAGADYVAFGALFASQTKPEAVHCPLETVAAARAVTTLPIVVIGGITVDNVDVIDENCADAIAVCRGLFDATDILAAARRLSRRWDKVMNNSRAVVSNN